MGIFMIVAYPSIMNTMAVRNLDNATREIQTFLQQTKLQAVNARVAHRVHFYQPGGGATWAYVMEGLQEDGTWLLAQRTPAKTISTRYTVTFDLPVDTATGDPVAVFSSLGMFPQYAVGQNSLTLQSPDLLRKGQDDERVLSMYMGGAIQYLRRKSA
jgi:Tfp pilus assembly protein FimT